jgi:uncharacterized protein (TIGR02598 family)
VKVPLSVSRGFSLVEVVLSLGIISFALVALLGITAVGTSAGLASKWDTEGGQIFEQIMGQLRTKPYTATQAADSSKPRQFPLPALNVAAEEEFYLDDRNNVVAQGLATRKVRVVSQPSVSLPYLSASGTTQAAPGQDVLSLVTVEISPHPPRSGLDTSVYFAEVSQLQQ